MNEIKGRFNYVFVWIISKIDVLFEPCHVSSLALTRIILGILLLFDAVHERGLSRADIIWSEQMLDRCRFPVVAFMELKLSPPAIYGLYSTLVIGLLGIILGYHYRISALLYFCTYWTLFLQDRSRWNNHSYLFGLLALLFLFNDSNRKWSLDVFLKRITASDIVQQWQYFLLRFQIFLVYFYAGLKKTNPDWLLGYSMVNLSKHWIFAVPRIIVPSYWIDYYLIHLGGFLFDILVGFLFIYSKTRWLAFMLCSAFNLINSQMFQIGMFPWVMLAMMPIFCSQDWPMTILRRNSLSTAKPNQEWKSRTECTGRQWNIGKVLTLFWIILYILIQTSLPFAFLVLGGFNTWTTGIYGYNWDMMVHNWNHLHTQVKVRGVDQMSNQTIVKYINSELWTHNHRWSHHADMAKQFALCIEFKLRTRLNYKQVQVFIDVWTSLNGRFAQRIYNPKVDLVKARWSPFETPEWVIPIYKHSNSWRQRLQYNFENFDHLVTENQRNGSLALFLADKPGGTLQTYIDTKIDRPVKLIVFDQMLWVKILNKNVTREFFLTGNNQVELQPSSIINIGTLGPSESYFGLLYPKLKSRSGEQRISYVRINSRNAWLTSFNFFMIGVKFLVWDILAKSVTQFTWKLMIHLVSWF